VCGHGFCRDCVKTWYFKSDEPTCPMCRRAMYFKGMSKVVEVWEQDRLDKKNEDAFNQAFEDIFDEEDLDSEMSWETESEYSDESYEDRDEPDEEPEESRDEPRLEFPLRSFEFDYYSQFILEDIKQLQKDYQKAMDLGVDFEWYINNIDYFDISYEPRLTIERDILPHFKNLFVSNHGGMIRNKRSGKRVPTRCDTSFTVVFQIAF
jgi:hypothetical protein